MNRANSGLNNNLHYPVREPDRFESMGKPVPEEEIIAQECQKDTGGVETEVEKLESPWSVDSSEHHTSDYSLTETRSTSIRQSPMPQEGKRP